MQTEQQSNVCWVPCESYAALVADLPKNACELLTTSDANSWGYITFGSDAIIPIGYADSKVVTPAEMELSRLRAENVRLKRENEIIKKAAAYFAQDVL